MQRSSPMQNWTFWGKIHTFQNNEPRNWWHKSKSGKWNAPNSWDKTAFHPSRFLENTSRKVGKLRSVKFWTVHSNPKQTIEFVIHNFRLRRNENWWLKKLKSSKRSSIGFSEKKAKSKQQPQNQRYLSVGKINFSWKTNQNQNASPSFSTRRTCNSIKTIAVASEKLQPLTNITKKMRSLKLSDGFLKKWTQSQNIHILTRKHEWNSTIAPNDFWNWHILNREFVPLPR